MITQIDTFVGIDPGSNGGIAWFGKDRIQAAKMPENTDDVDRLKELQRFMQMIKDDHQNVCIFIEKVQAWQSDNDEPGKNFGIIKLIQSMTELMTTATLLDIPFVPVAPVSWQSMLGLKNKPKGETDTQRKNRYKEHAQNRFPEMDVTLHTSDALCLVEFGLIKYQSDPDWIWKKIKNNKSKGLFD